MPTIFKKHNSKTINMIIRRWEANQYLYFIGRSTVIVVDNTVLLFYYENKLCTRKVRLVALFTEIAAFMRLIQGLKESSVLVGSVWRKASLPDCELWLLCKCPHRSFHTELISCFKTWSWRQNLRSPSCLAWLLQDLSCSKIHKLRWPYLNTIRFVLKSWIRQTNSVFTWQRIGVSYLERRKTYQFDTERQHHELVESRPPFQRKLTVVRRDPLVG